MIHRRIIGGAANRAGPLAVVIVAAMVVVSGAGPLAVVGSAAAVPTVLTQCTTITTPGEYVLGSDLSSESDCIRISVSDVVLDGAGYTISTPPPASRYGIVVEATDSTTGGTLPLQNVVIRDVTLVGWGRGVFFNDVSAGVIADSRFEDNFYGVYLQSSDGNTLSGNEFVRGSDGIFARSSDGNTLSNNVIDGANEGIDLEGSSDNVVVTNTLTSNGLGISAANGRTFVRDNTIGPSAGVGIRIGSSGSSGSEITGNTVSTSGRQGIYVAFARNVRIEGNTVTDSGQEGIYVPSSDSAVVVDNTVLDSTGADFRTVSSTDDALVEGLTLRTAVVDVSPVGAIRLSGAPTPPATPTGFADVDQYVDLTLGSGASAELVFSYQESAASSVVEADLEAYRYDGTDWGVVAGSTVDTGSNTVSAVVTTSGVVAPLAPEVSSNEPPTAAYDYVPTDPEAGEEIQFDGSLSTDPDGDETIVSYTWDFGDGTTATGATVSHTYAEPGEYFVTLVVSDGESAGATGQFVTVVVFANPIVVDDKAFLPGDLDGDGVYDDINGDGVVSGQDSGALASIIDAYLGGTLTLTQAQIDALDFNGDGQLTGADNAGYNRRN